MNDKQTGIVASVVVFLGLVGVAVAIATAPHASVNTNVGGDTTPAPVVVSGTNGASSPTEFGAYNNKDYESVWIRGRFDDNLRVIGDLSVSGTINGVIRATSTQGLVKTAFTGSASSQALCSIAPPVAERVLRNAFIGFSTSTVTGGVVRFTISLASAAATTGTTAATNLFSDITLPVHTTGLSALIPTSTLIGYYASSTSDTPFNGPVYGGPVIQRTNQWLNFMIASPTTTISGNCFAEFD